VGKEKPFFKSWLLKILVPFSLLMVAPVFLLAPIDHHMYFGYIGITVYHSATMAALRPLALGLVFLINGFFLSKQPATPILIIVAGMFTVLATLAKPNFTIAFFPALGILLLVNVFTNKANRWLGWRASIFGFFIPATLVLLWQFIYTYFDKGNTSSDSSIIFAPLLVFKLWSTSWLLPKFFLSILFPLGVFIAYLPSARKDVRLLLAWLTFLIGASYGYLLAETVRTYNGNFIWSGQIGLFILFVFSLIFVFEQYRRESVLALDGVVINPKIKISIVLGLYAFHVIAGVFWYLCHLDIFGVFSLWW
jgi:hypothetical protein